MISYIDTKSIKKINAKKDSGVINSNYTPSEGEAFLAEFLEFENIRYIQEKPVVGLFNDSKQYRKADFYLPNYGVYMEFLGRWNNTSKDRDNYREKKKVFRENKIPCVYIYPENLGIIEFSFERRLINVLRDHRKNKELLRYRLILLKKRSNDYLGHIFLGLILIVLFSESQWLVLIPLIWVAYTVYKIYREWKRIKKM